MMRWLFLVLVFANVSFLGWNWLRQDIPVQHVAQDLPDAGPSGAQLVVLRELATPPPVRMLVSTDTPSLDTFVELEELPLEEAGQPEALRPEEDATVAAVVDEAAGAETVAKEAVPQPVLRCLRLGGFESESAVSGVVAAMQKLGTVIHARGELVSETKRYRVMVPPAPDAAAATQTLKRLQRAGVRDFYLIRSGDNRNAISLGVYSGKEQAQRRVLQIRETKINPRIEDITVPIKQWWLEFDWAEDEAWRDLLPAALHDSAPEPCH